MYLFLLLGIASSTELTFELEQRSIQCFMEDIPKGEQSILEFQVVTGGKLDIDIELKDSEDNIVYEKRRTSYDQAPFTAKIGGIYKACFSNKFSSISHKVVFLDWLVGDIDELERHDLPINEEGPLSKADISAENVHSNMRKVRDYQTHHRLREASGRSFAEQLYTKIHFWGFLQSIIMVLVSLSHVVILRSFFQDRADQKHRLART
ncbi:unnamed protein product [Oikopleura dioica]|uniref:GOLD domain-containing protein n=1 Tax=Oikopleura dioica TaxID=34765 RepID=E4X8T8_OIKDI|nr:unnamed protein product [Oikopleura dioica]